MVQTKISEAILDSNAGNAKQQFFVDFYSIVALSFRNDGKGSLVELSGLREAHAID